MKPQSASINLQEVELQKELLVVDRLPHSQQGPAMNRSGARDPRIHIMFLIDGILAMGGGEGALLKIVRYLPRDRFRCSLAVFKSGGELYKLFREAGCPVHDFPVEKILSLRALKSGWRLRKFMQDENVDIVHTFFETANLWGALVTKIGGGPLLVSSRRDMGILRSAKHRIAYRLLHPLFDSVVAVSEPVRAACIREEGIAPHRVITLHNGVELNNSKAADEKADIRAQLGITSASHVVTSVGHIRRFKGFDVFIRAAAIVCRQFPEAVFVIVGALYQTDHVAELMEMAQTLGVSGNVRFAGAFDDVSSVLNVSNVFCLLSKTEGFSNALVEAMGSSLPAVATRVGGAEETIDDGRDGFLVNSEDAEAAAERILILLRNPDMARRMGDEARKTVRAKFTAEIMANTLAEHYDQLLRDGRSDGKLRGDSKTVATPGRGRQQSGKDTKLIISNSRKMLLRSWAKWGIIRVLWITGMMAVAKWWIRRHGAVVLSFHRILQREKFLETTIQQGMIVSDESFKALLQYLQKYCLTIDLNSGSQQLKQKRVQVALTFDDGWEDNASTAFPIAAAFKTPFTIFICPGLMGRSLPFWPERVNALIRCAEQSSDGILNLCSALAAARQIEMAEILCQEDGDRAGQIIEQLKKLPIGDRDRIMKLLFSHGIPFESSANFDLDRTMSWSQAAELSANGVTFGSHTQCHEILPLLSPSHVREEISESHESIREHLSKDSCLFSYPNGDASAEVREAVSQSGFKLAFINSPGVWRPDGDPLLIPRINLWENHLTDSRGRFSALKFEYAVFWRAFIHDCLSRVVKKGFLVSADGVGSALPLKSAAGPQTDSVSPKAATVGGQAETNGS